MRSCSHSPAVWLKRILDEVGDLGLVFAVGADIQIDLERGEAAFENLVDHLLALVEIHAGRDLTVGVDPDAVAKPATEQFADGRLEGLALEVP